MARYTLPAMTPRSLGGEEGIVFQKCGPLFTIRTRSVPVDKKSIAQTVNRSRFAAIASQWRDRSAGEKATFDSERFNYPLVNSLGDTYYQPDNSLFLGSNIKVNPQVTTSVNTMPAVVTTPTISPRSIQCDWSSSLFLVWVWENIVPADVRYSLFVSRPLPLPLPNSSDFDYLLLKSYSTGQDQNETLFNEYSDLVGLWSGRTGWWINARVDCISTLTGQRINFEYFGRTITG